MKTTKISRNFTFFLSKQQKLSSGFRLFDETVNINKDQDSCLCHLEAFDRMSSSNDDMKDNLPWKCLRKLSSKTKERHKNIFSVFITPAWYMQHMEKYWEDYYPCKCRLTVLALFCASLFYIFMKNCSFSGNFLFVLWTLW